MLVLSDFSFPTVSLNESQSQVLREELSFTFELPSGCSEMERKKYFIYSHCFNFRTINPAENLLVSILAVGEGWHNYHHTFPWDYNADELGHYRYNVTSAFLDFMAWIGWAYDLKTVPKDIVMARVSRTGDGTYQEGHYHIRAPWGWGDNDIREEDAILTQILHPLSDRKVA